jgi:hypothetical protein
MKSREDMGVDPPQARDGAPAASADPPAGAEISTAAGSVAVMDIDAASIETDVEIDPAVSVEAGVSVDPSAPADPTALDARAPTGTEATAPDWAAAATPSRAPILAALRSFWASPWRVVLLVALPAAIGLVHVWLISSHYFVGSFDDDGSYLLTAQAVLHGAGLDGHLASGASVVGAYPPGYPFLLVPLLWIWPHTFTPERVFSAVAYAAVFPLLWAYLGRRKIGDVVRFTSLLLLAVSPVMATFGSMVMAETSFLVLLLVMLILADGWHPGAGSRVLSPRGIAVIVAAAGLVWLKEAGVGIVIGLALWYLLNRDWRKSLAVFGGFVLLMLPVLVARAVGSVPLAGSRYSQELGNYYSGGLVHRLDHVLPTSFVHYFSYALPATLIPHGSPLPGHGDWHIVWGFVAGQAVVFTVLGLLIAIFRHRDAAVVAIPVYAAETLMWPEVNERRVILILPIIAAWYALGVVSTVRWLLARIAERPARSRVRPAFYRPLSLAGIGLLAAAAIAAPQAVQFPRDYLYALHQSSSHPGGSRYMSILAAVGQPSTVIETDYESTTALYTGHLTANAAFVTTIQHGCNPQAVFQAFTADRAGYLLIGTVNRPKVIDSPCLFRQAVSSPSTAVRLLRTSRDQASVFELIGPGTAHPDLSNLLAGSEVSSTAPLGYAGNPFLGAGDLPGMSTVLTPVNGQSTLSWTWGQNVTLDQVSVGEVGLLGGGSLSGVSLEVQRANGSWVAVADAPGLVGDGGAPYLLGQFPANTRALGMRLVVRSTGPVVVSDANALGRL